MSPADIQIALLIGNALVKYGPQVAADVRNIFTKEKLDLADWDAVFERAKTPFGQGLMPGVLVQDTTGALPETFNIQHSTPNVESPETNPTP